MALPYWIQPSIEATLLAATQSVDRKRAFEAVLVSVLFLFLVARIGKGVKL